MTDPDAAELLRALARLVAREVVSMLSEGEEGWIDQHASPLGNRRHVKAIRTGKLPGRQLGRRWVARRADVDAYLADTPKPERAPKTADELAVELGLPLRRAS